MIFRTLDPELDVSIGGRKVSIPRYSDNTALTAYQGLEHEFGMKMNVKKTKTMIISKKAVPRVNIKLDGQVVGHVSCFTYLGQTITEDKKCNEEIKRRIGQARSALIA